MHCFSSRRGSGRLQRCQSEVNATTSSDLGFAAPEITRVTNSSAVHFSSLLLANPSGKHTHTHLPFPGRLGSEQRWKSALKSQVSAPLEGRGVDWPRSSVLVWKATTHARLAIIPDSEFVEFGGALWKEVEDLRGRGCTTCVTSNMFQCVHPLVESLLLVAMPIAPSCEAHILRRWPWANDRFLGRQDANLWTEDCHPNHWVGGQQCARCRFWVFLRGWFDHLICRSRLCGLTVYPCWTRFAKECERFLIITVCMSHWCI